MERKSRRIAVVVSGLLFITAGLVGVVVFCIPWGHIVRVNILDAQIGKHDKEHLFVDIVTDKDFMSLVGTKWSRVVYVVFNVDDKANRVPRSSPEDFKWITLERPYFAEEESRQTGVDRTYSRWKIRLRDDAEPYPFRYTYDLEDGQEHTITLEVYGADHVGGYVTSVPIVLRIPALKK